MYRFTAALWQHEGGKWWFVSVPAAMSDDIEARTADQRRGFGSVRVRVKVGTTTWDTSLFPDTKRRCYVLPVKQPVRRAEGLEDGKRARFEIHLVGH
jgi:hypothetical protein